MPYAYPTGKVANTAEYEAGGSAPVDGSRIGAGPTDVLGRWWNNLSGKTAENMFNSAEAQKAREFEADQALINRDFNSAEAQKQRDWETMMSNTAYQRQVADMKAAGINPAMASMTSGASTPQGSSASAGAVPNGSAAHSAGGGSGGLVGLLATVVGGAFAKMAAAKIMSKASSAKDAAGMLRTVTRETMRAEAASKLAEQKNHYKQGLIISEKVHGSKKYWQFKPDWEGVR